MVKLKREKKPATTRVANMMIKSRIINEKIEDLLKIPKHNEDTIATYFQYLQETPPVNQLDYIKQELESWSQKPTSIIFWDFLDEYSIPERSFYAWCEKHEDLKEIHTNVIRRIGSRRLKLAMFKEAECNEKTIYHTLRLYSKEHREIHDEDLKNKRILDQENDRVTVIIKDLKEIKSNE
jgi:hypothetical protein